MNQSTSDQVAEAVEEPQQTSLEPYVDPEEAELDGGMADPVGEVETVASALVVAQAKALLGTLIDGLDAKTAPRVLNQISKVAKQCRQTLAVFDAHSGIELDGLSRHQQKHMLKHKRRMNRETAGVRVVQEVMGLVAGIQQSNEAKQLQDLLKAAAAAEEAGMTERATQLREKADGLAEQLVAAPTPSKIDSDKLAKGAAAWVAEQADVAEGFGGEMSGVGYAMSAMQGGIASGYDAPYDSDDDVYEDA